jgi:hypothetical protein
MAHPTSDQTLVEREKTVYCTVRWSGIHHWSSAPPVVDFLQHPHRHEFRAEVHVAVGHDDRDVEFIMLKQEVEGIAEEWLSGYQAETSCEEMCHRIAYLLFSREYSVRSVEVSEDGENGAKVLYGSRKEKAAPPDSTGEAAKIPLRDEVTTIGADVLDSPSEREGSRTPEG